MKRLNEMRRNSYYVIVPYLILHTNTYYIKNLLVENDTPHLHIAHIYG